MDITRRQITKIARVASKLTVQVMKEEGIGTAEYDFIHVVRHHPGITQVEVRQQLNIDKGAAARRAQSLENKGFLIRKKNPLDARSQLLYATKKADQLKTSKASIEAKFYEWLLEGFSQEEKDTFQVLLNKIYEKSKQESQNNFHTMLTTIQEGTEDETTR